MLISVMAAAAAAAADDNNFLIHTPTINKTTTIAPVF